jgi:hypothetical protein
MKVEADYIMHPPGAECSAILEQAGREDGGAEIFAWFEFNRLRKNYGEEGYLDSISDMGMATRVINEGYLACFCQSEEAKIKEQGLDMSAADKEYVVFGETIKVCE